MRHRSSHTIWNAYQRVLKNSLPQRRRLGWCLLVAAILLAATNYNTAINYLPPRQHHAIAHATPVMHSKLASFMHEHTEDMGTISLFMFWLAIGATAYSAGWLLHSLSNNLARPKARARRQFAAVYAVLVLSIGGLLFLLYALYDAALPAVSYTGARWIKPSHSWTAYVWAASCVIAIAFYLYAVLTVIRLSWRTVRFVNFATKTQRRTASPQTKRKIHDK